MPSSELRATDQIRPDVTIPWTDDRGNRWLIAFELKYAAETLISGLIIRGESGRERLTQSTVRAIPLEQMLRGELAAHLQEELARLSTTVGPRRGRAGLPDDVLKQVSEIYNTARRSRQPVQQAVADAMQISRSAAAKRIMSARQKGLISNEHETETK